MVVIEEEVEVVIEVVTKADMLKDEVITNELLEKLNKDNKKIPKVLSEVLPTPLSVALLEKVAQTPVGNNTSKHWKESM